MLKDAHERLERKMINYKTTHITADIKEQFSNVNLFAIQSLGESTCNIHYYFIKLIFIYCIYHIHN